jgi:hypothetical protein
MEDRMVMWQVDMAVEVEDRTLTWKVIVQVVGMAQQLAATWPVMGCHMAVGKFPMRAREQNSKNKK